MDLCPLKLAEGIAGTIVVVCKATNKRLKWNDAVLAGWVADLDGEAFRDYYSPEGAVKRFARRICVRRIESGLSR